MTIREIKKNKRDFLPLLLLADEQESMIERYIHRGHMFILEEDDTLLGLIVVTDEGKGILEIKNLAVRKEAQRKGYGQQLIQFIKEYFKNDYSILQIGTGDSPLTIPFYEKCGFERFKVLENFFFRTL